MRLSVAGEKTLQPQQARLTCPPDKDRAASPAFQQAHAAQNQGAHNAFPEPGLLHHHVAQPI